MRQIKVRKVPYGDTFTVFEDQFVALDYVDGGVLAIRRKIWKDGPFDEAGGNHFVKASIAGNSRAYLERLALSPNSGHCPGDVLNQFIDLKATDEAREYGRFSAMAGLLTLEQYGKYQHIIPNVDTYWWLATPLRTPDERNGDSRYAWTVDYNGITGAWPCESKRGIRPTLLFRPDLTVSWDDGEVDEPTEDDYYDLYLRYIQGWVDSEDAIRYTSPMHYEEWREDHEARQTS